MIIKQKLSIFATALAVAFGTSACCSFNKCTTMMPQDGLEDQANMPYVAQAQKEYEQRLNFRRPVIIKPSGKAQQFLTNRISANISIDLKRELLMIFEQDLKEQVSNLRDFEVITENAGVHDIGETTETMVDEVQNNNVAYLMEFEITSISYGIDNTSDIITGLTIGFVDNKTVSKTLENRRVWIANAQVTVTLTSPDGKRIFSYSGSGSDRELSERISASILKNAVQDATKKILNSYNQKFGPPMYVKQTIGGRHFVQISAGSEYGIKEGMKIEFFRNQPRTLPELPGKTPKIENQRIRVATGTAGYCGAPIEKDSAWVHVDDCDEEQRATLLWTSARVIAK